MSAQTTLPLDDEKTLLLEQGDVGSSVVTPHQEDVPSKVFGEWLLKGVIGILFCFIAFKLLQPWVLIASILVFRLCILYTENSGDLEGNEWSMTS